MSNYYEFSEEVKRIITNLEETDQFKVANKRQKEKNKDPVTNVTGSIRIHMLLAKARVDADRDIVMATTNMRGY